MGRFYQTLKQLGVRNVNFSEEGLCRFSLQQMKQHNEQVSHGRLPVDLEMVADAVAQRPIDASLGFLPTRQEFRRALSALRESSPGKDAVTSIMLRFSGVRAQEQLYRLVCQCWTSDGSSWDSLLTTGLGVMLFKTGDKNSLDNYRCIVLLSMMSRLIGKIVASRLSQFAETHGLFSDFQFGNRKHRSVTDALFVVRMVLELAAEVAFASSREEADTDLPDLDDVLSVVPFDIRKAFPSVDRQAAYALFARLGMPDSFSRVISNLHDHTHYQVFSRAGLSDAYRLQRGFREGCCSSPGCYSIFHDQVMRIFRDKALTFLRVNGSLPVTLEHKCHRPFNKRAYRPRRSSDVGVRTLLDLTFADDTSMLCRTGVRPALEALLEETLTAWGEEIKQTKLSVS